MAKRKRSSQAASVNEDGLFKQVTACATYARKLQSLLKQRAKNVDILHQLKIEVCRYCEGEPGECSFRNTRVVSLGNTPSVTFESPEIQTNESVQYRQVWSSPLEADVCQALLSAVSRVLQKIIISERDYISQQSPILSRKRNLDEREFCDSCLTTLFMASFFCKVCGCDICPACYDNLPISLICKGTAVHDYRPNFIAVTRFNLSELDEAIASMAQLPQRTLPATLDYFSPEDIVGAQDPSRMSVLRIPVSRLTDTEFRAIWGKRIPLVVTNTKLQLPWTPQYISAHYGREGCCIENCETGETLKTTVGHFFEKYESVVEEHIWKLKDWPPNANASERYPVLYMDFCRAVPAKHYTLPDGILNLVSHYPLNWKVMPDLGPKVYASLASIQDDHHHGSTRLHMDMSDAVNILAHTTPSNGTALWHIYRVQDAEILRKFIKEMGLADNHEDPIHGQKVYLNPSLRKLLTQKYGIKAVEIQQTCGEAVFIPAGCAHQVSNDHHCVKVAYDFVSPESLEACLRLTEEFRKENSQDAWKDDVLQLKVLLWDAWTSLRRRPDHWWEPSDVHIPTDMEIHESQEQSMPSSNQTLSPVDMDESQTSFFENNGSDPQPVGFASFAASVIGRTDARSRTKGGHALPKKLHKRRFECPHVQCKQLFYNHGLIAHLQSVHAIPELLFDDQIRLEPIAGRVKPLLEHAEKEPQPKKKKKKVSAQRPSGDVRL